MTEEQLTRSLDWKPHRHSVAGVPQSMEGAVLDSVDGKGEDGKNLKGEDGKRSFRKYFKKRRTVVTASSLFVDSAARKERAISPRPPPITPSPQKHELIRVMASVLHPQIHYKTIPITEKSSAFDVIVALLDKYAVALEDQNPAAFYLAETQEEDQGSYSRVLEGSEKVYDIQMKWKEDKNCYFTLNRKTSNDDNLDSPVVISATVCSPSQDSLFSGSQVFLDEGLMSPTFSEFMSDSYFSVTSDGSSGAFSRATFSPVSRLEGIFSFSDTSHITPSSPGDSPRGRWGLGDTRQHSAGYQSIFSSSPTARDTKKPTPPASYPSREPTMSKEDGQKEAPLPPVCQKDGDTVSLDNKEERESPRKRRALKLAMQRSMSEGLQSIMDRVISERDQTLSADSHPVTQEESSLVVSQSSSFPNLKTLACSPMQLAQKNYAQFVYSPPPSNLFDHNSQTEQREEEEEEEEERRKCLSRRSSSETTRIVSPNVHKVSKAMPHVQFATEVIVHPAFHTTAGLYPSFVQSNYYSSEMDMFASISSMLSTRISGKPKPRKNDASLISRAKQSQQSTAPSMGPARLQSQPRGVFQGGQAPGNLMSPTRRSKMIDEATRALKFKKPHSASSEQPSKSEDSAANPVHSTRSHVSETNLVSLSHRDKLLERATSMFKRTQSFSLPHQPRQGVLSQKASDQRADRERRSASEPPSSGSLPWPTEVTPNKSPTSKQEKSPETAHTKPCSPIQQTLFSRASPKPSALAEPNTELDDSDNEEALVIANLSALDSAPLGASVLEQSVDSAQLQRKRLPSEVDEVDTLPALVPRAGFQSNLQKRFHSMDNLTSSLSWETDSRHQPRGHFLKRSLKSFTSLFSSRLLSGSHGSLSPDSLAQGKPSRYRRHKTDPTLRLASTSGISGTPKSSQSVENLACTEPKAHLHQPFLSHDKNSDSMRKSQSTQCLDGKGVAIPERKVSATV